MSDPVSGIPMMRITPSMGVSPANPAGTADSTDFGAALQSAVESAIDTGHQAEAASMKAITQGGNVTEVATALSRAELTLQTATAVRDRMLQAYQDIMRIQI
jgi:flagellar hook-basal body complex protein FliE